MEHEERSIFTLFYQKNKTFVPKTPLTQGPSLTLGVAERLYWTFDDPRMAEVSREEQLRKFREVLDQIEARIKKWLMELDAETKLN